MVQHGSRPAKAHWPSLCAGACSRLPLFGAPKGQEKDNVRSVLPGLKDGGDLGSQLGNAPVHHVPD